MAHTVGEYKGLVHTVGAYTGLAHTVGAYKALAHTIGACGAMPHQHWCIPKSWARRWRSFGAFVFSTVVFAFGA